jgi:hypothetical protein
MRFNITLPNKFNPLCLRLNTAAFALVVAFGSCSFGTVVAAAESSSSSSRNAAGHLLKGKIEQHDGGRRLQRPAMPSLAASVDQSTGKSGSAPATRLSSAMDLGSDGFTLNFNNRTAQSDDTTRGAKGDVLVGEAENSALVIAWENWHKRVCEAIFEHWKVNGNLPGVAHARLHFTRDRHVSVVVQDVYVDPLVYQILPVGSHMSPQDLDHQYRMEVLESVSFLDGSPLLEFPSASKRTEVLLTPAFRGTSGPANFTWKRDDFERVPR